MVPFLGIWGCKSEYEEYLRGQVSLLTAETIIALQARYFDETQDDPGYTMDGNIATIDLHGAIVKESGWWNRYFGMTSSVEFAKAVERADNDMSVKSLYVDCDSPGGVVMGTVQAYEAVLKCQKPIVFFVNGLCCSCAYWIACGSDAIYGREESQSGNMGCYTHLADSSKMYERMGISIETFRSGVHKGVGIPGTKSTPAQRAEIQKQVDGIASLFFSAVGSGRKLKGERLDSLTDGRTLLGGEAVDAGLLDGVCCKEDVMSSLQQFVPGNGRKLKVSGRSTMGRTFGEMWQEVGDYLSGKKKEGDEERTTETRGSYSPQLLAAPLMAVEETPQYKALNARLDAIEKERKEATDRAAEAEKTAQASAGEVNRSIVASYAKDGLLPAGEIDKYAEVRAKAPEVFDTMIKGIAKPDVLTPKGDKVRSEAASEQSHNAEEAASNALGDAMVTHIRARSGVKPGNGKEGSN